MLGLDYINKIESTIQTIKKTQMEAIESAAEIITDSFKNGGIFHVFGCGHSQMYAEEVFYRAGGLVRVNAILEPSLSLRPQAPKSTYFERQEGYANQILKGEKIKEGDVLFIASTSGRNAVPIEMALGAQERGLKVIALTSKAFTDDVESRHPSGKKLIDIADVVLDNCGVSGDAVMEVEGFEPKFGPTSSIAGFTILQSMIVEVVGRLLDEGVEPEVWVSSNLDKGDEINKHYIKKYSDTITCL